LDDGGCCDCCGRDKEGEEAGGGVAMAMRALPPALSVMPASDTLALAENVS
jgi:hypothetical protein